jgi:hypothetical protein
MAVSREQSIAQYGTEAYTGWGEREASEDAARHPEKLNTYNKTGSSSTSASPTADEYAKAVLDAQEKQRKEETSYIQKNFLDNPFVFDEEAARKASTDEYAPYYQNLLSDYLKGVQLKRENIQDEQGLLKTLKQYDLQSRTRAADYATEKALQGYVGQGMIFSGLKERAVGRLGIEAEAGINQATENYAGQEKALGRQTQGLELESGMYQAENTEQQKEAIAGGIAQRRGERQKEYYTPKVQQYQLLYGTPGNMLGGYGIEDYLKY